MRSAVFAVILAALAMTALAQSHPNFPPGAEAREDRLLAHAGPRTRAFVKAEAAREARVGRVSEAEARATVQANAGSLGAVSEADISALVVLVMMQITRDADAELRDQMARMQAANARKQALRDQAQAQRQAQAQADAQARAEYDRRRASGQLAPATTFEDFRNRQVAGPPLQPPRTPEHDSISDVGELGQMRMQMLMDRRSKAQEALSNLMKKFSDTQSGIISNMK